jgi:hypothetical protein
MNTITTEPATKRARNASVVLTDRHCQKRVAKRIKIYDRKCPGLPHDTKLWEWRCGFYPGSNPGEHQSGTAASFAEARANFESAWKIFLSKRTEADFQAWRDQRDWTAEKYRRFDRGERMPHNWRAGSRLP